MKKSHSTERAKRATFTFWVDKSLLKMPKIIDLAIFWKTDFSKSVIRHVMFNRTIIGWKLPNEKKSNATFWVIFKHCPSYYSPNFPSLSLLLLPLRTVWLRTFFQVQTFFNPTHQYGRIRVESAWKMLSKMHCVWRS